MVYKPKGLYISFGFSHLTDSMLIFLPSSWASYKVTKKVLIFKEIDNIVCLFIFSLEDTITVIAVYSISVSLKNILTIHFKRN